MESPLMNTSEKQSKLKTSISTRLIAALAYIIPAIGGALSSYMLIIMLQLLRQNETAGIQAVMQSMSEAMIPALGSLYLGIIGGFVVIIVLIVRMFMQTETASPSSWFFIFCGFLFLVPAGLFFEAESMIIEVLIAPMVSTGIGEVASTISLFLILSIVSAFLVFIIMLAMSVIPFSARSKPKWSPLITATAIEFLLIATVVVFQLRFLWLYQANLPE